MLFYITLFFAFLYFKIARVHNKEESFSKLILAQHFIVAIAISFLLKYGFNYINIYILIVSMFVCFIVAALFVTAIQLGIFVDGKPTFGKAMLYKYYPILAVLIFVQTVMIYIQ